MKCSKKLHSKYDLEKLLVLKVNKRLDEWVTADRLDMKKVQFPKKEAKTPTKNGLSGSRPSSPEREVVGLSYTTKCLPRTTAPPNFGVIQSDMAAILQLIFLIFPGHSFILKLLKLIVIYNI